MDEGSKLGGVQEEQQKSFASFLTISITKDIWEDLARFRAESTADLKVEVLVKYENKGTVMTYVEFLKRMGLWDGRAGVAGDKEFMESLG